jgi:hypothetical protein
LKVIFCFGTRFFGVIGRKAFPVGFAFPAMTFLRVDYIFLVGFFLVGTFFAGFFLV